VLGNSHGFDHCGSTSGFIIWINKKGIMVDPPPFTSKALRKMDIPPNLIDKIILTHCHSDHDAGAF
jgi:ribonuclease BN (tRNA processing enzyme)